MTVEKMIIKRTNDDYYELYADEQLLYKTDDPEELAAILQELYQGAPLVPYVKKPQ